MKREFVVREFNSADTLAGWLNAISESNEVRVLTVTPLPSDPELQNFRVLVIALLMLR